MTTVANYFEQAQLSLAAYALDLQPGMFGGGEGSPYHTRLIGAGMSSSQATEFANTYRVVDQIQDPTGFSATVFEDTNGVRHFTIRGTEGLFSFAGANDWLTNVADIGPDGIAIHQGLATHNRGQTTVLIG